MGSVWSHSSSGSSVAREKLPPADSGLPFHKPNGQSRGEAELSPVPPLREDIEHEVQKLPKKQQAKARQKIREFKDAIQPHTDEGGDAHYIGDAYEDVPRKIAIEWESDVNAGPYLEYVRSISEQMPHLEYLALWMTVGCAPPKWRLLKDEKQSRSERVARTKVCVMDLNGDRAATTQHCDSVGAVERALEAESGEVRLLIVEDLSRDIVEMLGSRFDIDPLFFLSHLGDYLFHNTRDRWVELPDLYVDARDRTHFNLQYLRPRYFKNEAEFVEAEKQSGMFNVLRRLDSDRSRKGVQHSLMERSTASVTLTRAKTSLWIKPRESSLDNVTAILLVDPTVKNGSPLWSGYRPFQGAPSMKDWTQNKSKSIVAPSKGCSLYDSVVYWSSRTTKQDIDEIKKDPKVIGLSVYKLVIAEWLAVLKYMTSMFAGIEWSLEKPHWGESLKDMSELLKKLSPWRRNIGYYQVMVEDAIAKLFPAVATAAPAGPAAYPMLDGSGINKLWADFKNIKHQMDEHKARIAGIQTMATNAINTEEARRAVKQNRNLARLTFLATIFIPLNFTSSFLSVSPDFAKAKTTIWLFFVIGIPLTLTALITVDLLHPEKKGFVRKHWYQMFPKKEEEEIEERRPPSIGKSGRLRAITGAWPYHRSDSSFMMK